MNTLLAPLLSFLLLYKYWALFTLAFTAAVLIPIPMNTILLATGAFASQGYFDFTFSFLTAFLGNIAGDICGYICARIYGRPVLKMFHIHQPTSLLRFEHLVKHRAFVTIFVSRFIGGIGTLVNLLSGFIEVNWSIFLLSDICGNSISVFAVLYAGYFFGGHWQDFSPYFTLIDWTVVSLVVIGLIV